MRWFARQSGDDKRGGALAGMTPEVQRTPRRLPWLVGRSHAQAPRTALPTGGANEPTQCAYRYDLEHDALRQTLRTNTVAPIKQPTSVLDLGSGSGRWASEVAWLYPQASVIGIDLVAPASQPRPTDYAYIQVDLRAGLPFAAECFDYLHARFLGSALPASAWPALLREVVRVAQPGAWVELVEAGPVQRGGPALTALGGWADALAARTGLDPRLGEHLGSLLGEAGVAQVTTREIAPAIGTRGKVGRLLLANALARIEQLSAPVVEQGIVPAEEYAETAARAREELRTGRCLQTYTIAYGQRP